MFCPNCGTQNPDAAQTCSKCNFNIKGAAAPKFKGTMLMMNQPIPGAPPGVGPQPPAPAAGPPPAAPPAAAPPAAAAPAPVPGVPSGVPRAAGAQSAMSSKLKGTMVGVAPMSGGAAPAPVFPATAPMAAVPAPAAPVAQAATPGAMGAPMGGAPMGAPPPQGFDPSHQQPPMQQPPAYSPPGNQGVNPLGGTVAADGGFAQFAQQAAAAAAAAAAQNPYGQPGGQPGQYGAPPQQYGAPPGGAPYGAPPQQFGSNPPAGGQPGYGAPPQAGSAPPGYGGNPMAPQGGMMPYGGAGGSGAPAAMAGTLPSAGAVGAGPTKRNPLMMFLMPFSVMVLGNIVANVLFHITPGLAQIGSLITLGGVVWYLLLASQMIKELKDVTGNASLAWWPLIVPIYGLYFALVPLRQEVTKAKQMRGVQAPTRGAVLYLFLLNLALAADLNDLSR